MALSRYAGPRGHYVHQATWEAEELRKSNLDLQTQLSRAEGTAEDLQETIAQLKHQLQSANQQVRKLDGFAKQCEAIPGLKKSLSSAETRGNSLEAERDKLQVCRRENSHSCHLTVA